MARTHKRKEDNEYRLDDGNWYAMTLGEYISLLVDGGGDVAVKVRVLEDRDCEIDGAFIRDMQVVLLPNGVVKENIKYCKSIDTLLSMFIEGGVIN